MLLMKDCCGCCSLRTGSIIIGAVGIVGNIVFIILLFTIPIKIKAILLENVSDVFLKVMSTLNMAFSIALSCLLIVGAVKRQKWFVLPAVVSSFISVVGLLVSVIYTSVEYYLRHDNLYGTLWIVFGLIAIAVAIFFCFVLLSFYLQLKNEGPGA